MSAGHFLGGIAALIWRADRQQYLLLRRADSKDFAAGSWECPTGRVDQGESFGEALRREVREELGAEARIEFFVSTTHFYRGDPLPENELLGIVCCCSLTDPDHLQISHEHDAFQWLTAAECAAFLPQRHWLQPIIARAELFHAQLPETVRAHFRENGLETLNNV